MWLCASESALLRKFPARGSSYFDTTLCHLPKPFSKGYAILFIEICQEIIFYQSWRIVIVPGTKYETSTSLGAWDNYLYSVLYLIGFFSRCFAAVQLNCKVLDVDHQSNHNNDINLALHARNKQNGKNLSTWYMQNSTYLHIEQEQTLILIIDFVIDGTFFLFSFSLSALLHNFSVSSLSRSILSSNQQYTTSIYRTVEHNPYLHHDIIQIRITKS